MIDVPDAYDICKEDLGLKRTTTPTNSDTTITPGCALQSRVKREIKTRKQLGEGPQGCAASSKEEARKSKVS